MAEETSDKQLDSTTHKAQEQGQWEFDQSVTDCFEDMLGRSIPGYAQMRDVTLKTALYFMKESRGPVLDLGCSRAELLKLIMQASIEADSFNRNRMFIGCDISEPMLEAARENLREINGVWRLEKEDLREDFPYCNNAAVIIANLTLQFTPIEHRLNILRHVRGSLEERKGVFILTEKVLGENAENNAKLVDLYYDFKEDSGYTREEIDRKRLALEGVLVPQRGSETENMLRESGFGCVQKIWQHWQFCSWMAY